jgi:hypothetical protein
VAAARAADLRALLAPPFAAALRALVAPPLAGALRALAEAALAAAFPEAALTEALVEALAEARVEARLADALLAPAEAPPLGALLAARFAGALRAAPLAGAFRALGAGAFRALGAGAFRADRDLARVRAAGGLVSGVPPPCAVASSRRAALRRALERCGRVRGRLARTPSLASAPGGRPLFSLAAVTDTSLLNAGAASAATIARISAGTR